MFSLGTSASRRFERLITQMTDTEFINRSPEQHAQLCGCSLRHFNRLFREHFGASPRARQTELRLIKAWQILASTDTNARIAQVASDVGYRNVGLFNTLFKDRFGMTPSECREQAAAAGSQNPPS